mmetsp:Transcript_86527/g.279271  ORF Transcript_86527/g.279271 Transcript_86527/m.279271 type:complete len:234 (+) Transcript_86527:1675-2376(+)
MSSFREPRLQICILSARGDLVEDHALSLHVIVFLSCPQNQSHLSITCSEAASGLFSNTRRESGASGRSLRMTSSMAPAPLGKRTNSIQKPRSPPSTAAAAADFNAQRPNLSFARTSARTLTSSLQALTCPCAPARCSGVWPSWSFASRSARCRSSSLQTSTSRSTGPSATSPSAAPCSGVPPSVPFASTSARWRRSSLQTSTRPSQATRCSGVRPAQPFTLTSARCRSSSLQA